MRKIPIRVKVLAFIGIVTARLASVFLFGVAFIILLIGGVATILASVFLLKPKAPVLSDREQVILLMNKTERFLLGAMERPGEWSVGCVKGGTVIQVVTHKPSGLYLFITNGVKAGIALAVDNPNNKNYDEDAQIPFSDARVANFFYTEFNVIRDSVIAYKAQIGTLKPSLKSQGKGPGWLPPSVPTEVPVSPLPLPSHDVTVNVGEGKKVHVDPSTGSIVSPSQD